MSTTEKLVANLPAPDPNVGGDTQVDRNLIVNKSAVMRQVHIPTDSSTDGMQTGLFFGQECQENGDGDAYVPGDIKMFVDTTDSNKFKLTHQVVDNDGNSSTKEIFRVEGDKLIINNVQHNASAQHDSDVHMHQNILMKGAESSLQWVDKNDESKHWEIIADYEKDEAGQPTPNHRLEIRHSGQTIKLTLTDSGGGSDDVTTWNDAKKYGADAIGRYPYPIDPNGDGVIDSDEQGLWEYKPFPELDDNNQHSYAWGKDAVYYEEVQPAIIVDDEEVKLMSNVYVDGKLVVNEGTSAAFGDIADFSKNVYARAALEVGGYFHAKQNATVKGTLRAEGSLIAEKGVTASGQTISAADMVASASLKSGSGNFEAGSSGSVTIKYGGEEKFKIDSTDSFKVTAKGEIHAEAAGDGLVVTNNASLNTVDTRGLLTIKADAELEGDKALQIGDHAQNKLFRDAADEKVKLAGDKLKIDGTASAELAAPNATVSGTTEAKMESGASSISVKPGLIESSSAAISMAADGNASISGGQVTAAATGDFIASGGSENASLELKAGDDSKLQSAGNLLLKSSEILNLSGGTGVDVAASGGQGIQLSAKLAGMARMSFWETASVVTATVQASSDGILLQTANNSNKKIELVSDDVLNATSNKDMSLKSTNGEALLQGKTAAVKAANALNLRSDTDTITLQANGDNAGAHMILKDKITLESKADNNILLRAMGTGKTVVEEGPLEIAANSLLQFALDGNKVKTFNDIANFGTDFPIGAVYIDENGFMKVKLQHSSA